MILTAIVLVIMFIILGVMYYCDVEEEAVKMFSFLGIPFIVVVTFITSWGICDYVYQREWVGNSNIEIYSISNNSQVDGRFYFGSGRIEEKMYYIYYVKGSNGGYVINKIKADNVEVIEREDTNLVGNIKIFDYKFKQSHWFLGIGKESLLSEEKVLIYVPKGTITIDFDIGLSNV